MLSALSKAINDGKLNAKYHVVLDEAYKCTNQELCPWKGSNLDADKDVFNYYLSLHRQVIERAFGLLVARFGIFWRVLRVKTSMVPIFIKVCCKLHNLCIDKMGPHAANKANVETTYLDTHWVRSNRSSSRNTDDTTYTDGVQVRSGTRTDTFHSDTRERITASLYADGIRRPLHSLSKKLRRIRDRLQGPQNNTNVLT